MLSISIFIPCIAGGYTDGGYRDEIYSHAGGLDGAWEEVGRLATGRSYGAATLLSVNFEICK